MAHKHYFIFNDSSMWSQSLLTADEARIANVIDDNESYVEVSGQQLQSLEDDLGADMGIADNVIVINGVLTARPSKFHTYDADSNQLVDGSDAEKIAEVLREVRNLRDFYLAASDWTQMPDSPLTTAKKAEWATYRQALRDMPTSNASVTDKSEVTWPSKPS